MRLRLTRLLAYKVVSSVQNIRTHGKILTVITKALSGRANFGIVANVSALVASTTRKRSHGD